MGIDDFRVPLTCEALGASQGAGASAGRAAWDMRMVPFGISGQIRAEGARNESDGFRRRSHDLQSLELILPACRGGVQTSFRRV